MAFQHRHIGAGDSGNRYIGEHDQSGYDHQDATLAIALFHDRVDAAAREKQSREHENG